jgi:hypothetical protein
MFYSAFLYTLITEWLLFTWLCKETFRNTFIGLLLINLTTWPVCTYLYNTTSIHIIWLELGVMITEAVMIMLWWKFQPLRAAIYAIVMNCSSWLLGSLIQNSLDDFWGPQ